MAAEMTGIVLAGGRSTRMGRDKATLPWGTSDLLHTVLARLAPVSDQLIVVSNKPRKIAQPGVEVISDRTPGCGPLAGIYAGLSASRLAYSFVAACDMPFLNTGAVAYIRSAAQGYDAAVPLIGGYYNPLHAVYHRNCLPFIERLLAAKNYQVLAFYPAINLRPVSAGELTVFDPGLLTLSNVNTPGDFCRLTGKTDY